MSADINETLSSQSSIPPVGSPGTPDARLPLVIGGVMRCCVASLDAHEQAGGAQAEGTIVPCLYCESSLHVVNGKWKWCGEYPCTHRAPASRKWRSPMSERPDCTRCKHPARYHINFAHEGKPVPPGPPDIPRKQNFCRHPMSRGFCACRDYIGVVVFDNLKADTQEETDNDPV